MEKKIMIRVDLEDDGCDPQDLQDHMVKVLENNGFLVIDAEALADTHDPYQLLELMCKFVRGLPDLITEQPVVENFFKLCEKVVSEVRYGRS